MDDLISRQAAIEALNGMKIYRPLDSDRWVISDCLNKIVNLPSAERRGRWVFNIDDEGWSWDKPYMCDQCGEYAEKVFKFCPNCGATMEAGE